MDAIFNLQRISNLVHFFLLVLSLNELGLHTSVKSDLICASCPVTRIDLILALDKIVFIIAAYFLLIPPSLSFLNITDLIRIEMVASLTSESLNSVLLVHLEQM